METFVRKNRRATWERIDKFISDVYFADVNLYKHLYPEQKENTKVEVHHFAADGRIGFEQLVDVDWTLLEDGVQGKSFGPTWSTHWFKVKLEFPRSWVGACAVFRWDSGSEAMIWDEEGKPEIGLSEEKKEYVINKNLTEDELERTFYVEMACNTLFGAGKDGMINAPDPNRTFPISRCDAVVKNLSAYSVFLDLKLLLEVVHALGDEDENGFDALYTGNAIVNAVSKEGFSPSSFQVAHKMASDFFSGSAEVRSRVHRIHAVGNCHIDSAWLWPYEESERKAGRSFTSAVQLMTQNPSYKFVASQAQQFEWVKNRYPTTFQKMKDFASRGRFIPVGGVWVEMDGNLPSGESFCRQFIYGQRFFEKEFGMRCKEFWLPDTFGYSAQLPQIMRLAEIEWFVTQKLSWSLINKFPHNSFIWEGIDGSKVLAHFPPGDSYEMKGEVEELVRTVKNNKDKGRVKDSLFLYGHGDGGGGPTQEMITRLERLADVPGLPCQVKMSAPEDFFFQLEKSRPNLCSWVGELYLELHQGTFTTQALTKRRNREMENLLRETEFVCSLAFLATNMPNSKTEFLYPKQRIEDAWKKVLLNQFHDVLPGSSIQCVYVDALRLFAEAKQICDDAIQDALDAVFEDADLSLEIPGSTPVVLNSTSFKRREVLSLTSPDISLTPSAVAASHHPDPTADGVTLNDETPGDAKRTRLTVSEIKAQQTNLVGETEEQLVMVEVEPFSLTEILRPLAVLPANAVSFSISASGFSLSNSLVAVTLTRDGHVMSMRLCGDARDAIRGGHAFQDGDTLQDGYATQAGNAFVMYDDIPLFWDAWDVMDYHLETAQVVERSTTSRFSVLHQGPLRVAIQFQFDVSKTSSVEQIISLDADSPYLKFQTKVDWHENRKFLKVRFPLNVRSPRATYEIQYGHLDRPTHQNTSWDAAKHEVCGHKWADISEHDFGVALINDSKYGHSVTEGNVLTLSLLRSPKAPDPEADMGVHEFSYALMPHRGTFQEAGVVQAAYAFNAPLRLLSLPCLLRVADSSPLVSFFRVSSPAVVLDCVKKSDFTDGILLRFYESFGSQVQTVVTVAAGLAISSVKNVNILETQLSDCPAPGLLSPQSFPLDFVPFQVRSVILNFV